jgi:hypothetical protein
MILYVNGDSHSVGVGVPMHDSFAYIVAQKVNMRLENQSSSGASNQKIIRTTREYIKTNRPNFVLIGWSTWEREEWLHNDQYYQINSSGAEQLPPVLQARYKTWVATQDSNSMDSKSQHWHEQIYQLHLELKQQNIQHLFFNCMYNFFKISKKLQWINNYVDPYDNESSYYWYLKNKNYTTDSWYHYGADGHGAWAEFLINYIRKYKLL